MRISIFGLGYVGVVTAACLSTLDNEIVGVDVNETKVNMLNDGISPIIEKNLPELLNQGVEKGIISATIDVDKAILNSEISIVCVGTPSRANGSLNTVYIENVCKDIGKSLSKKTEEHIIIFRSTMLPGTTRETVIPMIQEFSGKINNKDFHVVFNPEFLRESTAVFDFFNPPKTVVGADNEGIALEVLKLYDSIKCPVISTTIENAEMVKYVDNNFHALKITFANEIGYICKNLGIDSHEVMNIFKQDKKLNISEAYLNPGFAFGGSCLPKDLRAINYMSKMLDLDTPLLNSMIPSNNSQILSTIKNIISFKKKKIGIVGISFKEGTDDLRESPIIEIIETLIGKGYKLKIYDKNVAIASLIGANKEYIKNHIPHISSIMVKSIDDILEHSELIVIGNRSPEFKDVIEKVDSDTLIYDLVRIGENVNERSNYYGICW